ncbi:protein TolA [Alicycliphilus sp. B1]|nr:protein TolA [Alicycliphilus sp. B1]
MPCKSRKKREEELKKKHEQQLEQEKKDKERRERLEQEKKERLLAQQKAEREKAQREKASTKRAAREGTARETAEQKRLEQQKAEQEKQKKLGRETSAARPRRPPRSQGSRCAPPGEHPPHAAAGRHRRIRQRRDLQRAGQGIRRRYRQLPLRPATAGKVAAKVKPNIVYPDLVEGNPRAEVEVRAAPDGTIVGTRILHSSGNKAWDDAGDPRAAAHRDPAARRGRARALLAGDRLPPERLS